MEFVPEKDAGWFSDYLLGQLREAFPLPTSCFAGLWPFVPKAQVSQLHHRGCFRRWCDRTKGVANLAEHESPPH